MKVTKIYDEHTGDPVIDNRSRNLNRALHRSIEGYLRPVVRSRRRRAAIMRAEFPRYAECVAFVAEELHRQPAVIRDTSINSLS